MEAICPIWMDKLLQLVRGVKTQAGATAEIAQKVGWSGDGLRQNIPGFQLSTMLGYDMLESNREQTQVIQEVGQGVKESESKENAILTNINDKKSLQNQLLEVKSVQAEENANATKMQPF